MASYHYYLRHLTILGRDRTLLSSFAVQYKYISSTNEYIQIILTKENKRWNERTKNISSVTSLPTILLS